MAFKKKPQPAGGAPEWVVTFGDMMSLLLCFFVILVSMSEIKKDDKLYARVLESIRQAFGNTGQMLAVPSDHVDPNTLLMRLKEIVVPHKANKGDSDDAGIKGKVFRVTDVREGIHVEIGGRITFDRFSATLKPEAEQLVAQVAATTRGHTTIIKVTGHATKEPLPPDSPWKDVWDLSYARARAVGDVLAANGISPARLRLTAAGSASPVKKRAYTEAERAQNRRVEVVVTEATVDDHTEEPALWETRVPTDG